MEKKALFINPHAKGGTALRIWSSIGPELEAKYGPFAVFVSSDSQTFSEIVGREIEKGTRIFLSAGGDGGVNYLINTIIQSKGRYPLSDFTIGGIGLGSSNDYHKPFENVIHGIPFRCDSQNAILRDVVELYFSDMGNREQKVYFLASSSIGIIADANATFNKGAGLLRFLKKTSTPAAILWAFFRTLSGFKNLPVTIRPGQSKDRTFEASYLAVSKTPYISSTFHFKDKIERDDGRLLVKLFHDYSRSGLVRAMPKMSRGDERGLRNIETWFVDSLEISSVRPFVIEYDGETAEARRAVYHIFHERVRECA